MQITTRPAEHPLASEACQRLRHEWVVQVEGRVVRRSDPNPQLPSGQVELIPSRVAVLNTVPPKLPLLPSDPSLPREETRLRNRVLDLRLTPGWCSASQPHEAAAWRSCWSMASKFTTLQSTLLQACKCLKGGTLIMPHVAVASTSTS